MRCMSQFSVCVLADLCFAQGSTGALLFRTTLTKEVASKHLSGYKVPKPLGDVEETEEEVLKTSSFRLFRRSEMMTGKTKNKRKPRA